MNEEEQNLKQAINIIIESGYQIDSDAFEFLKNLAQRSEIHDHLRKTIQFLELSPDKPLFLTKDFLETHFKKMDNLSTKEEKRNYQFDSSFTPYAKEVEGNLEVLEDARDIENSEGNIENYMNYFRDRFSRLERILRERSDVKDAVSVDKALKTPLNKKFKTIGLIIEKKERKNSVFIRVEDYESNITFLVPSTSDKALFDKTRKLFIDQILCVEAIKIKENVFIAKDFISPDIPERKPKTSNEPLYAIFTSDLHIGSKRFLTDTFNRFISWLKGRNGNGFQKEIASRVKYLIIAGDIVEGIGIYPGQEKDLEKIDIYEQYNDASDLIEEIPEYIKIIITPGNHDATRQALPQPAILEKYAKPLYNLKNVTMLGSPARIRISGVEILVYHGRSLDDIIGSVPDVTYLNLSNEITGAMKYLLKMRHLAPIYGSKTPIAPGINDQLVINTPPDILHMGHVHVIGYERYRGTLLINSGTWQQQTEFQEKMGIVPNPGIVPIVDLKNLNIIPINFIG